MADIAVAPAPAHIFEDPGVPALYGRRRRSAPASSSADGPQPKRRRKLMQAEPPSLPCTLWLYTIDKDEVLLHGLVTIDSVRWRCDALDSHYDLSSYFDIAGGGRRLREHKLIWQVQTVQFVVGCPFTISSTSTRSWTHVVRLEATPEISSILRLTRVGLVYFAIRIEKLLLQMFQNQTLRCLTTPTDAVRILRIPLPPQHMQPVTPPAGPPANPAALANTTTHRSTWKGVAYEFDFRTIVNAIRLKQKLKSSNVDIGEVCSIVWDLSLPPHTASAMHDLRASGKLILPKRSVVQEAQIKLDICYSLLRRFEMTHMASARYVVPDSSPQAGYDILCIVEDTFSWPLGMPPAARAALDPQACLARRTLPLSTLGYGASSALHKSANLAHILKIESGDDYDRRRLEVKAIVSDQGAESAIADMPLLDAAPVADMVNRVRRGQMSTSTLSSIGFMFPAAIYIPDHLHLIFGSSKEAFVSTDLWKEAEPILRSLAKFLRHRLLLGRFVARCLPAELRPRFRKVSFGYADWKWEYMHRFLDNITPVWSIMVQYFDKAKLCDKGDEAGFINPKELAEIETMLSSPVLFGVILVAKAIMKSLDLIGTWCEGCRCHEAHLFDISVPESRRLLNYQKASATCQMKGRRGCEAAVGDLHLLLLRVDGAPFASQELQRWYSGAEWIHMSVVKGFEETVMAKLMERLRDKLSFWKTLPYKLLGLYNPDPGRAKAAGREILTEYQTACAAGVEHKLHRVARRFLGADSPLFDDLRAFSFSHHPLRDFVDLFLEVQAYALAPLVSRKSEGLHAMVKSSHMKAPRSLIPFLSSRLRQDELVMAIADQRSFDYLSGQWRLRGYLDRALRVVIAPAERWMLKARGAGWKKDMFYQCCLTTQFKDQSANLKLNADWGDIMKPVLAPHPQVLSDVQRLFVQLMKDKFSFPGLAWSVPVALVEGDFPADTPLENVVDACVDGLRLSNSPDPVDIGEQLFFMVNNSRPEQRKVVLAPHVPRSLTLVEVSLLQVRRQLDDKLVVVRSGKTMQLDLCRFAHPTRFAKVFAWQSMERFLMNALGDNQLMALTDQDLDIGAPTELVQLDDGVLGALCEGDGSGPSSAQLFAKQCEELVFELSWSVRDRSANEWVQAFEVMGRLPGLHKDHLDAVAAASHVEVRTDEFGDLVMRLADRDALPRQWVCSLGEPVSLAKLPVTNLPSASKLDLVLHLLRDGFTPSDAIEGPHLPHDGKKFVPSMLARSRHYLLCMAQSEMLFGLGLDQIHPGRPNEYYHCLLELPIAALLQIHQRADFAKLNNLHFRQLRSGFEVSSALVCAARAGPQEDALEPIEDEVSDVEDELAAPPLADDTVKVADVFRPATIRGTRILFDYFSHCSGIQRAYARCRVHERCFRYAQCNRFPRRTQLVAYLYAWQLLGARLDRTGHQSRDCQPDSRIVDELEAEVQL